MAVVSGGEQQVVVVGGGVVGCAAAYYQARAGLRPVLVERGEIGMEASGRNGGAIRRHGRRRAELPLATAGLELWREFSRVAPLDFFFQQSGDLVVAFTEKEVERLYRSAGIYRQLGLPVDVLTGAEARRLVPGLAQAVRAAAYAPTDAQAYPALAVQALALAAARAGATILTHEAATGLAVRHGRVEAVMTSRRRLPARVVVNAAGPWARGLAATAGINLPIAPRRSQIMVTERLTPGLVRPFVSGNRMYCRQSPYGNMVIGGGGPWEPVSFAKAGTARAVGRLAARFGEVFPALRGLRIIRAFAGTVELTPDHLPLLGPVPGVEGLLVAAGLNGNGFALGPAVGHLVADLVLGREPIVPVAAFRPDRFPPDLDLVAALRERQRGLAEPI